MFILLHENIYLVWDDQLYVCESINNEVKYKTFATQGGFGKFLNKDVDRWLTNDTSILYSCIK